MRELRIGGREESRAQRGIGQPENATPPEDCTIAHPLVFYPLALAFHPVSPCPPVHFSLVLTTTSPIYIYTHTHKSTTSRLAFVPGCGHSVVRPPLRMTCPPRLFARTRHDCQDILNVAAKSIYRERKDFENFLSCPWYRELDQLLRNNTPLSFN